MDMHPDPLSARDDVMDWESTDAIHPRYIWPPLNNPYLDIPPRQLFSHYTPATYYTQLGHFSPWFMHPRQTTRVLVEENARVRAELESLKGESSPILSALRVTRVVSLTHVRLIT